MCIRVYIILTIYTLSSWSTTCVYYAREIDLLKQYRVVFCPYYRGIIFGFNAFAVISLLSSTHGRGHYIALCFQTVIASSGTRVVDVLSNYRTVMFSHRPLLCYHTRPSPHTVTVMVSLPLTHFL